MEYIDCKSIAQKWKDEIKAHGIKGFMFTLKMGFERKDDRYGMFR